MSEPRLEINTAINVKNNKSLMKHKGPSLDSLKMRNRVKGQRVSGIFLSEAGCLAVHGDSNSGTPPAWEEDESASKPSCWS